MDIRDSLTFDDFIKRSDPYCVQYDFEPEAALPGEMSWTANEKWFCSGLAINDMQELMWAN